MIKDIKETINYLKSIDNIYHFLNDIYQNKLTYSVYKQIEFKGGNVNRICGVKCENTIDLDDLIKRISIKYQMEQLKKKKFFHHRVK